MPEALVNPRLLIWARERAQLDDRAIAEALKVPRARVANWESGEQRPTFRQAERWAQLTHTPFGLLFVSAPPTDAPMPADFRRIDGRASGTPSANLRDLYEDVQFKQDWFREYRRELGFPPVSFVGSVTQSIHADELAKLMRKVLNPPDVSAAGSLEDRYRQLIVKAEENGIWVLRSGTVAGNTHRPVPVDEFRGFAIADPMVPLVFINVRDAVAAQLFTLVHELAHLWLGASGLSDPFAQSGHPIERLCNAAAAEFLVPRELLSARWRPKQAFAEQCIALAGVFKVSAAVIAIRARVLNLGTQRELDEFLESQRAGFKRAKSTGGGDYYRSAESRNGRLFTQAVLRAAVSRDITARDGGALLNMSAAKLMTVARRAGLVR